MEPHHSRKYTGPLLTLQTICNINDLNGYGIITLLTLTNKELRRWCGPTHDAGQGMVYHVLTSKDNTVTRSTVIPVSKDKLESPQIKERMNQYTSEMESLIGNFAHSTMNKIDTELGEDPYDSLFEVDDHPDENDVITNPEIDDDNKYPPCAEDNDDMIITRVPLQRGGIIEGDIVRPRKRDSKGMHDRWNGNS